MPASAPDHRRDFLEVLVLPALTFLLSLVKVTGSSSFLAHTEQAPFDAPSVHAEGLSLQRCPPRPFPA